MDRTTASKEEGNRGERRARVDIQTDEKSHAEGEHEMDRSQD